MGKVAPDGCWLGADGYYWVVKEQGWFFKLQAVFCIPHQRPLLTFFSDL